MAESHGSVFSTPKSVMRLSDIVDERALAELNLPTSEARGLPGAAYGEDFYALETRHVFPRCWAAVAVGSEIPNAGDALPVMLGETPLVLVRQKDGTVRCFHNVCRHRGMRLVPEACQGQARLVCPWHSWTYDLAGQLVKTPNIGGPGVDEVAGLDRAEAKLVPVPVGDWNDFLFVNVDGNAEPFEEHRKPFDALFANYDLTGLELAVRWEQVYEGNWKISHEGGIEDYHIPWGHPQIWQAADSFKGWPVIHDTHYSGVCSAATFREDDEASGLYDQPMPTLLRDENEGRDWIYIISLFPTGQAWIADRYAVYTLFTPMGWNKTRCVFHLYLPGEAVNDPTFAEQRDALLEEWKLISQQDIPFVKYVHGNLAARDRAGIRPRFSSYWEEATHHLQKIVVAKILEQETAD
jgi:choline monooxygenase